MSRKLLIAAGAAALLTASVPLLAHHAFSAEFDANAPVTLRGPVTRVEWINPHAWIHVEVENQGRQERGVDGRGRHAEHAAAQRRHARLDPDWHRHRRLRLPGEGRQEARQRPRYHLAGRPHAVHGIVRHRRAAATARIRTRNRSRSRRADAKCAFAFAPKALRRSGASGDGRSALRMRRRRLCRRSASAYRAPRTAARHAGSERHLAGEQHGELGSRGARGAGRARVRSPPPSAFLPGSASSTAARSRICRRRSRSATPTRRVGEARSRGEVLHAGHSARHLHAIPVSDRPVGRQHPVHL